MAAPGGALVRARPLQLEALDQLGLVAAPYAYVTAGAAASGAERDRSHASRRDPDAPGATASRGGVPQRAGYWRRDSPEQTTQIFEPLHTTKPGGTGLGLYSVQEVIAAHGGQITVQRIVGQGSTLTITLPLRGQEETTENTEEFMPFGRAVLATLPQSG